MPSSVLYVITVLIWGSTWYAITFQLGTVHPMMSIAYRFAMAAVIIFIYLAIRGHLKNAVFTRQQHAYIALQGLFLFCLNYSLTYLGTAYIHSGLVAIVFSTLPLLNVFNQAIFFRIPVKKQVIIGSLIGFTGLICIFWHELQDTSMSGQILQGTLIVLGGSYLASLGNMAAIRNTRNKIPVIEGNAFGMLYGAAFSLIIALAMGAELTFVPTYGYTLSLIYLAIFGSAVAFGSYLTLMQRIGADKAAYASVLFPIVALFISTIFENYEWTALSVLGVVITLLGNVVAMTNRERLIQWRENFDWSKVEK